MSEAKPVCWSDVETCIDNAIASVGKHIVLALPLGLGKANLIANAFYRRAEKDPSLSLHIITALTLELPVVNDELSRRFMSPIIQKLYADVPELLYAKARRSNQLPSNIKVSEFFLNPGKLLGNRSAQQSYISSNYTHAVRDIVGCGVNILAQMIAPHPQDETRGSLSCNADLTRDLIDATRQSEQKLYLIAECNSQLPYLGNDADIALNEFDDVVNAASGAGYPLFSIPKMPVTLRDYAIALHVTSLIKDAGTLQIGIGSLGDAIAHMIAVRHQRNDDYRQLLAMCLTPAHTVLRDSVPVEDNPLSAGLYGCSEMLVEGLLHLRRAGVLTREVENGVYCHGGFYLGSADLYDQLRQLPEEDRRGISMSRISFINQLYGDESLKRQQRRHARFINSAMMVALTGEVVSDGLTDHQVVSGVGGQYNFVAQAHELDDGRSIICVPSTRQHNGLLRSNIVWQYQHTTIPRHLRDIVVTEYGAVDLRGKSDRDVIVAMLAITDSRFQQGLLAEAKKAGKVEQRYRLSHEYCANTPDRINGYFAQPVFASCAPHFPLGHGADDTDAQLFVVMLYLKTHSGWRDLFSLFIAGLRCTRATMDEHQTLLTRMQLDTPQTLNALFYRRLLLGAVKRLFSSLRPLSGAA